MKLGELKQHIPVKIIGLIAEKRHGKDTTAEQLIASGIGWERLSFADPLYKEVQEAFGLDDQSLLRDDATKDSPQKEMALMNCADPDFVRVALKLIDITDWPLDQSLLCIPLSPRQVLQWWGKEYRRAQDPLYWIKPVMSLLKPGKKFITTDIRYDTEIEFIVDSAVNTFVHVDRPGRVNAAGTHESDTNIKRFIALCSHKVVNRENDLDGLRRQIEAIAATL